MELYGLFTIIGALMRRLLLPFLGLFFVLPIISAYSQELSEPAEIVRLVVEDTIKSISAKEGQLKSKTYVYDLVKNKILPIFDNRRITARSVGREWLKATDIQKEELIENFTEVLTWVYSNALSGRDDLADDLKLSWGRSEADEKRGLVRSIIETSSGKYNFNYSMRNGKLGWKLDDIIVNNLSLFKAYRDQFASIIKNDGGLEGLIIKIKKEREKLSQQAAE